MIPAIIRKIIAFILVFILFAHNINTLVIIGDFILNQELIAKTLCIQKEEQKGCNGKCQLSKELSQNTTDADPEAPAQERERLVLDAFCLSTINQIKFKNFTSYLNKEIIVVQIPRITKIYLEIDTPPPNLS